MRIVMKKLFEVNNDLLHSTQDVSVH